MKVARFGAVFDLNGVIINDGRLHDAAWLDVANRNRRIKWTIDDLHRIAGHSTLAVAHILCPEAKDKLAVVAEKNRLYEISLRRELLRDPDNLKISGVCELIGQMADESISLALNTSSPSNEVELILNAFGLLPHFSLVLTGEVVPKPKPHPEGYKMAAKRFVLPPRRCVGFEDSLPGLKSLNSAGYGVIVAVGSIMSESQVRASGLRIDRYIPDFSAFTLNEISGLFLSS
jgi:beta-phosphoglucomutase-like phosphatase (HAD superfamily)